MSETCSCSQPATVLSHHQRRQLVLLQSVSLGWMLLESSLALFAAARAHSPVLLAFGTDSLVELLSAALVFFSIAPSLGRERVERVAGLLLFLLAAVIVLVSLLALTGRIRPETSVLGLVVTCAALLLMPLLAWQKRRLASATGNRVLAADAVQSATCAYLAGITLAGLAIHAAFGITWVDSVAALLAVPILCLEANRTMRGEGCSCC